MARIKQTARPPSDQPPSDQPPAKRTKTTSRNPAYFKEPVLPTFDFSDRIRSLPSPIHRFISLGDIKCPPKHGREYDWDEWLKTTAHIRTDSERPPLREDTPPASRPKKTRQNKAKEFAEKIKEHKRKRLQNSWDSVRVVEGVMKFDNPHAEGMTIIPIKVYRHQSMLDCESKDYVHGERLMYTESWASREPRILEGVIQTQKPRQRIGEAHSMIFLVPLHDPHDLFPSHFYETIRQRFRDREQLWGQAEFRIRGLLTVRRYYSEWAEAILLKHTSTLAKIGLYDAIEVTSQHFYREPAILKGFLEYWSPTTNSFHLPYGEMSISLWDLHRIAGLTITGKFYDEFIPTNRELAFVSSPDRKPSISETTIELFKEMGKFPSFHKIPPLQWLAHFSRGLRFRDCHSKELTKLRDAMRGRPEYSSFGELAAFLAYWLSLVVLPSSKWADVVRPSVFVVAGALAEGHKYSPAPPVLCSIYRALGEVATHIKDPTLGASSAHTSWHYITGWLGVYFPWTFEAPEQAYTHPSHLPLWFFQQRAMAKRAYEWVANKIRDDDQINFFQFRLHRYTEDTDMVDQETLTAAERAFYFSIRSCSLPLREGTEFWREPYYPSRFARQFGYDQTVPQDCGLVTRKMRCYGTGPLNWAMIWKQLLNGCVGSLFIIPSYDRIVRTSYSWMRWWDHQSYLVTKCLPVDSSIFLHPPRLKGRNLESGISYVPEKSHASHPGEICRKISLEDPIREIKPINTLDGWFAHGILREFEKTRRDSSDQAANDAEDISSPIPVETAAVQEGPAVGTSRSPPQPLGLSPSSPMTRSKARLQTSSPILPERTRQASASPAIQEPVPESSQPISYKGKQVIIEEADEEILEDESSASSSDTTESSQYEDSENSDGREDKDDDFEEGEVDIDGDEETAVKEVEVESSPATVKTLPGENVPAKSPAAEKNEEELLDYGEYGYSPGAQVAEIGAVSSASPLVVISPRAPIVPLIIQKVAAREIIFPTETTDLPTPATRDSSTEARAPSFADMVELGPSMTQRASASASHILVTGTHHCSGAASSDSVATSSELSSFAKIPIHKMLMVKHSLLAIIHIFRNPDQWLDLDVAIEILESSARMARINISPLRDSLLKFRDSVISLALVENVTIAPEILEYKKQLAVSQEQASLTASSISKLEQEHLILQDQLKIHIDENKTIQDRIAALKEEISQLERRNHEKALIIQDVEERIQANVQSLNIEKSAQLQSKGMIASLENKLAGVPDQAKLILEEKSKHDVAQAQLKEDLRKYSEAVGITEDF